MSNAAEPDTVEPVSGPDDVQPDPDQSPPVDLPPVEPPSAGFIIQLFVVPGLIVLAVVGIWAMFGQLAAGEQDWTKLVAELSNNNEHRRWRGAHGLAQMDEADQKRKAPEQKTTTRHAHQPSKPQKPAPATPHNRHPDTQPSIR